MRFFTYVSVFIQLQATATSSWQPKQQLFVSTFIDWPPVTSRNNSTAIQGIHIFPSWLEVYIFTTYIQRFAFICFGGLTPNAFIFEFFFLRRCYIKIILQYYSLKRKQQILAACSNTFALSSKSVSLSAITQWHTHTEQCTGKIRSMSPSPDPRCGDL